MRNFKHPTFAAETCRAPAGPSYDSGPTSQGLPREAPQQADEPLAEWEDPWNDLGGEG